MRGIDISNYQAGLDLAKAKSAGIEFVICKISEGRTYQDRQFDTFYQQAKSCGLPIGAYFYSHATTPDAAIAEVNFALQLLKGRELPLGIYMDIETETQMAIPKSQLTETVKAFCRTVEASGYRSGIYGSEYNTWTRISPADFPKSIIWVAHYGKAPAFSCDLWQKSDTGSFPGYSGPVDTDDVMSERFEAIVKGKDESPDPMPPDDQKPPFWDWKIAIIQFVMQCDGYWGEPDGLKSPEFFVALQQYLNDMKIT